MGTEAPKAALPARPALFQRLAAIDLVFEIFSSRTNVKKILNQFRGSFAVHEGSA